MASISKQIEFTAVAQTHLKNIIEYILHEFGQPSAEKFVQLLQRKLNEISDQKISYRYFYKSKQIRYFIIKRNYVLYIEKKKTISVVGIYGSKQDIKRK